MHNDAGIDYGMGLSNVDKGNGIRYGVISSNEVLQRWADSSEAQYSEYDQNYPSQCDNCGKDIEGAHSWGSEIECECGETVTLEMPDFYEPMEFTYDADGYKCSQSVDDSDIFIVKSPYYTLCSYCSPCAPGAGYITSTNEDGIKAYCFGHDWFEEGIAPYPVFRVEDDRQVVAERKEVACGMCHGYKVRDTGQLAEIRNEPIHVTEQLIHSGEIRVNGFDPEKHTFECNMCYGKGTREEVVETVKDITP
jgi:hypothetical protein